MSESLVVAIGGVAGSGKTTLGRALAAEWRLPLIDLDAVTTPLLDALGDTLGEHWLSSPHADEIRAGRYAALRAVVADAVRSVGGAVVVAPFTAELAGGEPWRLLIEAAAPAALRMVHVAGDPVLFAERRADRGEERDRHRTDVPPAEPAVEVLTIDAELSPAQQVARLAPALGRRTALDADAPIFARTFDAVLFDLDGTLVDSTASVLRSWRRFAAHYGVSAEALHENHGQPARVLIERLLPEHLRAEGLARITDLEISDAVGLEPVLGARALFESVPEHRRAVVTSGSRVLATARLEAGGFVPPEVFVTADDVQHGKPDPEPFLTAALRLGVDPSRCLVVEDAAAGIAAARAAGCGVLAVTGTVDADQLAADLVVDALDAVALAPEAGGMRVTPAPGVSPPAP